MKLCIDALATLYTQTGDQVLCCRRRRSRLHSRDSASAKARPNGPGRRVSGKRLRRPPDERWRGQLPRREPISSANGIPVPQEDAGQPVPPAAEGSPPARANGNGNGNGNGSPGAVTREARSTNKLHPDQGVALNIMLKHFHGKPEVWMRPYLQNSGSERLQRRSIRQSADCADGRERSHPGREREKAIRTTSRLSF